MTSVLRPRRHMSLVLIGVCALICASTLLASPRVSAAHPLAIWNAPMHAPRSPHFNVGSFGWTSNNWSGYAVTSQTYTSVTGSWVVPAAVKSGHQLTLSSAWVGIDGFNSYTIIQTGSESDYYGGRARYFAWWEIYPAAETTITSMNVQPGDVMTASVVETDAANSLWTITLTDATRGETFSTTQTYSGFGSSAEWIVEAPSASGLIATLAHYSPTTMDPGTANGADPGLTVSNGGVMIQNNRLVSTPSLPDVDQDGFAMRFGSKGPAAPSS